MLNHLIYLDCYFTNTSNPKLLDHLKDSETEAKDKLKALDLLNTLLITLEAETSLLAKFEQLSKISSIFLNNFEDTCSAFPYLQQQQQIISSSQLVNLTKTQKLECFSGLGLNIFFYTFNMYLLSGLLQGTW